MMVYSGLYRCSGCSVTFSDPVAWRETLGKVTSDSGMPTDAGAVTAGLSKAGGNAPSGDIGDSQWAANGNRISSVSHITMPLPEGTLPFGYSEVDRKGIEDAAARANRSKGRRR